MRTGISVRDAMTTKPIVIKPDISAEECAKIMLKDNVGSLVVKDKDGLVGIITEKDFVNKLIAKGLDPKNVSAEDIMRRDVITIDPNTDIFDAMVKMNKERIRRLPVVENGKMIGFLTHRDILKVQPHLFEIFMEHMNIMNIREAERKPIFRAGSVEGECENCNTFTLLHDINGKFICDECIDKG
ncbi:MAG: CBS domain-containing protein [Nanoarchaeota archaeon]